jgi:Trk K+ transport system NAD-binding subunit
MKKPKLRRPSPALVLAFLALVVAVVGTAAAAPKTTVIVRKGEIAKGAVTAKALAQGAVHPKALAGGAVSAAAIKPGAVGSSAIAPDSVTAPAIAPGSVGGGTLGEVTMHSTAITDVDAVADNGDWTPSAPVTILCGPGERVLSGGVVFTTAGNNEVGVITSQPFVNGGNNGWVGAITTNTGGLAKAEVQALCLK